MSGSLLTEDAIKQCSHLLVTVLKCNLWK